MGKLKNGLMGITSIFVFVCMFFLISINTYAYSATGNKLNTNYTLIGNGAEDIYSVANVQLNKNNDFPIRRTIGRHQPAPSSGRGCFLGCPLRRLGLSSGTGFLRGRPRFFGSGFGTGSESPSASSSANSYSIVWTQCPSLVAA